MPDSGEIRGRAKRNRCMGTRSRPALASQVWAALPFRFPCSGSTWLKKGAMGSKNHDFRRGFWYT